MNDPQTMIFNYENRITVTAYDLAPFQGENRNVFFLSSSQETCPPWWILIDIDMGIFWFLNGVIWHRMNEPLCAWLILCAKHFCRGCSSCVILDETSVLNQGSHA